MQIRGVKGKIFSIPRSRYSNRAVTVLEQCVVSYIFKDFYVLYQR